MSSFDRAGERESIADAATGKGSVGSSSEVAPSVDLADVQDPASEAGTEPESGSVPDRASPNDIDKLVIAIVHSSDANNVNEALRQASFGATRINAHGGFMNRGNAVFLIGIRSDRAPELFNLIKSNCVVPPSEVGGKSSYGVMFSLGVIGFERV